MLDMQQKDIEKQKRQVINDQLRNHIDLRNKQQMEQKRLE
jgi:hypothetical protein